MYRPEVNIRRQVHGLHFETASRAAWEAVRCFVRATAFINRKYGLSDEVYRQNIMSLGLEGVFDTFQPLERIYFELSRRYIPAFEDGALRRFSEIV